MSVKISSKAIICENIAKHVGTLQDDVRIWMTDPSSFMHGTSALVVGGGNNSKKLHDVQLIRFFERAGIVDMNVLTPRVLICTLGRIGAGSDCDDVALVARIGMPTNLIIFFQ